MPKVVDEQPEQAEEPEHSEQEPEPDPDEDPDEQPVAAPEGFSGVDEDALRRESQRHTRAMQGILGELFPNVQTCVYCDGSGVTPESLELPPPMKDDPTTEPCSLCNGLGLVKTGSYRDGQTERSCTNCAGSGYVTKAVQLPQAPQAPQAAGAPNGPTPLHLPPTIPAGTLEVLRAAGYTVFEPMAPPA